MGRFVHGFQRPCALGFFESVDFSMLEWEGDELKGVKPDFVRNVVRMLGEAKREQVRICMTLFDAQVYRPDRQKPESRIPWAFFADQGPMACADFFDFHLTRLRRDFGL
jgi:hypothetical protein